MLSLHRDSLPFVPDTLPLLPIFGAPPLLQDSNTPLHIAACRGKLEEAKVLVSHGADLGVRNKVGVTMISLRVCDGYVQHFFCVLGTV